MYIRYLVATVVAIAAVGTALVAGDWKATTEQPLPPVPSTAITTLPRGTCPYPGRELLTKDDPNCKITVVRQNEVACGALRINALGKGVYHLGMASVSVGDVGIPTQYIILWNLTRPWQTVVVASRADNRQPMTVNSLAPGAYLIQAYVFSSPSTGKKKIHLPCQVRAQIN